MKNKYELGGDIYYRARAVKGGKKYIGKVREICDMDVAIRKLLSKDFPESSPVYRFKNTLGRILTLPEDWICSEAEADALIAEFKASQPTLKYAPGTVLYDVRYAKNAGIKKTFTVVKHMLTQKDELGYVGYPDGLITATSYPMRKDFIESFANFTAFEYVIDGLIANYNVARYAKDEAQVAETKRRQVLNEFFDDVEKTLISEWRKTKEKLI